MVAGVVGLGLIGGSFAKAYHETGATVYAWNRNRSVLDFAMISGNVDAELTEQNAAECDIIIVALYPEASIAWLEKMAPYFGKHPLVMDACGTKRNICEAGFALAEEHGFTFVGGHPMAGTQYAGFKYARADMFRGAPMVVVPPVFDDIELFDRVKKLLQPLGFGRYSITNAEDHDNMIAFTSQLSHIIAGSYIKSPSAGRQKGFAGGSFRDMTRVAYLNPNMWAEIFLDNRDCLLPEVDGLIERLTAYRDAIRDKDLPELTALLEEGRKRKEELG